MSKYTSNFNNLTGKLLLNAALTLVLFLTHSTAYTDNLSSVRARHYFPEKPATPNHARTIYRVVGSKSEKKRPNNAVSKSNSAYNKLAAPAFKPVTSKPVPVELNSRGELFLHRIPAFQASSLKQANSIGVSGDNISFTVDPDLQNFVQELMRSVNAPHSSILLMDPLTGAILALADKSSSLEQPLQHAGFPAASLFKIVTAAAAIEKARIGPNSVIRFRGGNYQLDKTNYKSNPKLDKQSLTLGKAMGKSTNPVFSRVALNYLTPEVLKNYTNAFGFNTDLKFDVPLRESSANIPRDPYELGRTAAGFGQVFMSPIHAGSFMSAVANGGSLPKPHLIKKVSSKNGATLYEARPSTLKTSIAKNTGPVLMTMLENSVTSGTSRYAFYEKNKPILGNIRVAGKTGTLRGKNPVGQNRWFIGAAPSNNPQIVVIAHSINPRNGNSRPSYLARRALQKYFEKNRS